MREKLEGRAVVVNMKYVRDERKVVKIDRSTPWGNPYRIGKDGSRIEVIEKYRQWLWHEIKSENIKLHEIAKLHGRCLACHCHPLPCHGDILAKAAEWAHDTIEKSLENLPY